LTLWSTIIVKMIS